jgi:hypothetical protein
MSTDVLTRPATKRLQARFIFQLILIPAVITLFVTFLRLAGELGHWSARWFSPETGGYIPSSWSFLVGITWLPIPFGAYFALKLLRSGMGPRKVRTAVVYSLVGIGVVAGGGYLVPRFLQYVHAPWPQGLILIWLYMVIAAAVQLPGWYRLSQTLLYYGFASRIPVVIVMFLALHGNWGTHYDYVGLPEFHEIGFFWQASGPQLIFWPSFTVVLGVLSGSITAAAYTRFSPRRQCEI